MTLPQEQKIVDFEKLDDHKDIFKDVDTGFCCLGTYRARDGLVCFVCLWCCTFHSCVSLSLTDRFLEFKLYLNSF